MASTENQGVIHTQSSDSQQRIFDSFKKTRQEIYEDLIEEYLSQDYDGDEEPEIWDDLRIHDKANRLAAKRHQLNENYDNAEVDEREFKEYKNYMYNEEISPDSSAESQEEASIGRDAHDYALLDAKEDLLMALKNRKANILHESVRVFSALQAKTLKTTKLQCDNIDKISVPDALQKAEYLLNDHRSPILSALLQTEKYAAPMPANKNEYYSQPGRDAITDPIDIDMYERDNEKLQELADGMAELRAMIAAGNKKI